MAPPSPHPGLWSRWTGLLSRREPGTTLALFRIACGLCVLGSIGSALVHGVAGDVWLDQADGGYHTLPSPPWLFQLLGGVHPATLWPVLAALLLSAALLVVGLGGRVTALVVLQLYLAVANINWHVRGCDDQLIENALWLLVMARSTATLSLDCRLRTGRWGSATLVPAWPRYLAIYQLVLVYWSTGLQKISIHWTPAGGFSALYYILQEPAWPHLDLSWLAWVYPATQVATALTWFWEVSSPLLLLALWYRHTRNRPGRLRALFNWIDFRRLFVLLGIAMHLGVCALLGLGPFTWISLSFYICLFHPTEWQAVWSTAPPAHGESPPPGNAGQPGSAPPPCALLTPLVHVLVTLHVLAVTLMAIPAPTGAGNDANWKSPAVQEEFTAWAERLNRWGLTLTAGELETGLRDLAERYLDVRERLLTPFQPYYHYCGTNQGWRMFVGPVLTPSRLHVDVEEGGRWRPVYVDGDPDSDWLRTRLGHEHLRTAFFNMAFFKYQKAFSQFARWLAVQAAQDFPQAQRVRVRIYQFRTLSPEAARQGRRPQGAFVRTEVFEKRLSAARKEPHDRRHRWRYNRIGVRVAVRPREHQDDGVSAVRPPLPIHR